MTPGVPVYGAVPMCGGPPGSPSRGELHGGLSTGSRPLARVQAGATGHEVRPECCISPSPRRPGLTGMSSCSLTSDSCEETVRNL